MKPAHRVAAELVALVARVGRVALVALVALAAASCGGPQQSLNRACSADDECYGPQQCLERNDGSRDPPGTKRCTLVCRRDQECAEVLESTCFVCVAHDGGSAEDKRVEGACEPACD